MLVCGKKIVEGPRRRCSESLFKIRELLDEAEFFAM